MIKLRDVHANTNNKRQATCSIPLFITILHAFVNIVITVKCKFLAHNQLFWGIPVVLTSIAFINC